MRADHQKYNASLESESEEDLWFLPGPDEPEDIERPPGPKVDRRPLFDAAEWRAAEAGLAPDLAALCYDHGRLEERLASLGDGARQRIALQEAASLGWWTGTHIGADQLALWMSLRLGATEDDVQNAARLAWVVRRLIAAPVTGDDVAALAGHLGLPKVPASEAAWPDRVHEAGEVLAAMGVLHPVVRGCVTFHIWRMLDDGPVRMIEAAMLGMRFGAGQGGFLPVSLAGFGALTISGSAERRLTAWITGAHKATLAALLHLERLRAWQLRADAAIRDLSGRTPGQLIAVIARLPMLSAPVAEHETGASRAAVQRNLDLLQDRGLIREVTGQGRYRVWAAKV